MTLAEVRELWLADQPKFTRLATMVQAQLTAEVRRRGVAATCTSRPKDTASLLKKLIVRRSYDAYEELSDRAGARVVVAYPDAVPVVMEAVESLFEVRKMDDKRLTRPHDKLCYLGIHYDIALREPFVAGTEGLKGLVCEVQVQTRASNLWSDVSHELAYKPTAEVPSEILRSIYRLMALLEIFDETIGKARDTIMNQPGYEERRLLAVLESHYFSLAGREFSRDLSLAILGELKGLAYGGNVDDYIQDISQFATQNEEKLTELYGRYAEDERCSPLLFQPEALFLFEQFERDPFKLKEAWIARFEPQLLEELATVWGVSI